MSMLVPSPAAGEGRRKCARPRHWSPSQGLLQTLGGDQRRSALSFRPLACAPSPALCAVLCFSQLARRLSVLHAQLQQRQPMADEKDAARAAAALHAKEHAEAGEPTIFDKIISKEIPSKVVFEDDQVLAFRDISPQGPVHIILIPKAHDGLTQLSKAEERHEQILGHLMVTAAKVARQEKLDKGFRLVINDGLHGCQSVYHIHLHLIGGRQMNWPPG